MVLMICGAWCCVVTFAQNINPLFIDIDKSKCYRIVNVEKGDGGVGIGALHNSDIVVKYVDATEQNTDDCYWFIECHEQTIRFRNKATGQYLTYTPEKDYETFINLKLLPTPSEESEWHILAREGFLTFYHQADEKYYMGVEQAKNMVKASSGMPDHASKYFYMVDEQGKALKVPAITPFSAS